MKSLSRDPSGRGWVRTVGLAPVVAVALTSCDRPPFQKLEPPEVEESPWDSCDAGDAAWVQRVLPLVWGRQAHGSAEVLAWVAAVEAGGRPAVVEALTRDPAYLEHQTQVFMDALQVAQAGSRVDHSCWGTALLPDDDGALAARLATSGPEEGAAGTYTMVDVLHSALRHDDLSVVYRAALFARLHKPVTGANVGPLELEENRRIELGDQFFDVWLHRDLDCMPCHNGAYSSTDDPDPALDRTWQVPGLFEQALLGVDGGIDTPEAYAVFRYDPLVGAVSDGVSPFGLHGCGTVSPPGWGDPDLLGHDAYFITALGTEGSVWDVEAAVRVGVDALRDRGHQWAADESPSGPEAVAWLMGEAIVEQVWVEAIGAPLTLAHRFPRNAEQRDRLQSLTDHFVREGFSLRTLLTDVTLDPVFNAGLPDTCGADPYGLPPVIDPFSVENVEPELQGNGPGERVRRWPGRVLVRSAYSAMGWPQPPLIPTEDDPILDVYEGIGVSMRRSQPRLDGVDFQGLLAWENHVGACSLPPTEEGSADGCTATPATPGCGNCGCQGCTCALDPYCCSVQWDDACVEICEDDCGGCGVPPVEDSVDRLLAGAIERDATVRELVAALEDRLLSDQALTAGAPELSEAVLGIPLDHTVAEAVADPEFEPAVRLLCGALLRTPDFLMELERGEPPAVPRLALDVAEACARMEARMAEVGVDVACPVVAP